MTERCLLFGFLTRIQACLYFSSKLVYFPQGGDYQKWNSFSCVNYQTIPAQDSLKWVLSKNTRTPILSITPKLFWQLNLLPSPYQMKIYLSWKIISSPDHTLSPQIYEVIIRCKSSLKRLKSFLWTGFNFRKHIKWNLFQKTIRKPRTEKVLSGDLASKNLKHIPVPSLNNNLVTSRCKRSRYNYYNL